MRKQNAPLRTFGSPVPVIPSDYERKDHVTLLGLAARPLLALRTLHVFIPPFLPNPPTHLHEREGDGKQNILLGWP